MTDESNPGFKISDHRKFNPDGTLRDPGASKDESGQEASPTESESLSASGGAGRVLTFPSETGKRPDSREENVNIAGGRQAESAPPRPTAGPAPVANPAFDELVNMLTVEAVMHLGLIENPGGGGITIDLESARHMIDMLAMLQAKTSGNLTADEGLLIDNVVADLRMQFVAVSRGR